MAREIIGVYVEEEKLFTAAFTRRLGRWRPLGSLGDEEAFASFHVGGPPALKHWLERVPSRRNREIFVGLPRSLFFCRDFTLPPLPLEDALASVENSLPLYSHLPVEDVYFDVHLWRKGRGPVHVLFVYAPRRVLDPYLEVIGQSGHERSLAGLFPFSFGLARWFVLQGYPVPAAVLEQRGKHCELAAFESRGMVFSAVWTSEPGSDPADVAQTLLASRLSDPSVPLFRWDGVGSSLDPAPPRNRLAPAPGIAENPAVAVASVGVGDWQRLKVDPSPTRIKTFQPGKIIIPLILCGFLAAGSWTWHADRRIEAMRRDAQELTLRIQEIKKRLEPIRRNEEELARVRKAVEDVNAYHRDRHPLYTALNEAARLLPAGTWFPSVQYEGDALNLRCRAPDALKVIEWLRASELFEEVKLQGSVSRFAEGTEQFNLTIRLRSHAGTQ